MDKIKHLLNQVKIINQKNNEILDATGGRFNIFRVCGVNHYENTHSAILAEFLNPNGTHGLKHQFLQAFIDVLGKDFGIPFNVEKAKVKTEYTTSEGRIDIFIEDDKNNVIIIENKIYAGDQWEQLKRYDNFAKTYAKNYQIFYLTLDGKEADEHSGKGVNYTPISHEKSIIAWLEKCLEISTRYPIVRETIVQYINHLKTLTHQDMDTKNQQEVAKILANDLEAAQAIYQNYQAALEMIVEENFNKKMREIFPKKEGWKYKCQNVKDTYIEFWLQKESWENHWIQFSKDSKGYYYGLKNYKDKISPEKRDEFHKKFNRNITNNYNSEWIFWEYFQSTLTIEDWQKLFHLNKNEDENSDNFFNDCKVRIEDILKAMEGIEF